MKNVVDFVAAQNLASAVAGPSINLRQGQDTIRLLPVTACSVSLTMVVEELNPDEATWHISQTVPLTTAGAQTPLTLTQFVGRAIRVRIATWVSGTLSVSGYAGTFGEY